MSQPLQGGCETLNVHCMDGWQVLGHEYGVTGENGNIYPFIGILIRLLTDVIRIVLPNTNSLDTLFLAASMSSRMQQTAEKRAYVMRFSRILRRVLEKSKFFIDIGGLESSDV